MKELEWSQVEDLTQDWAFRYALIDALREIAEQLNKLNNNLQNRGGRLSQTKI